MHTVEIFSGAGGLARGLEISGFKHRVLIEKNRHACQSLRYNFPNTEVFEGDIQTYDFSSHNNITLVAGGPPCQPFSLGGKHEAHEDSRDMFPVAARTLRQLAPQAFLFENVKGLLRPTFAEYFKYILLILQFPEAISRPQQSWKEHLTDLTQLNPQTHSGLKYSVSYKLLDAADYGIPQNRERVFIIGTRADLGLSYQFPSPTHSENQLHWEKYGTGAYWKRHQLPQPSPPTITPLPPLFEPTLHPWKTIRDTLHDLPDPHSNHDKADHQFHDGARSYPGHTGSELDAPAKTLKAGVHGVPGGENMLRLADGNVRYLTILEAKRLQTFPDNYTISGAWSEALRQLGNAVPVSLATQLGTTLFEMLRSSHILLS